ncbi:MAG: hypothetical protein OXU74_06720 [Gemmatimonadota bacterium]|nr:hypothetical protein [Gemmatimonadota bacterium]
MATRLRTFGCRLKIYPTRAQAERFATWADAGSHLRDMLVERDRACYRKTAKRLTRRELQEVVYEFAEANPGLDWLAHSRNQHARDHDTAMRRAFDRMEAGKRGADVGWPRLRSGRPATIYVPNQMFLASEEASYVRLSRARHGWTRYRGTIPRGVILSGRVRRTGSGWVLTLSMRAPLPKYIEPIREKCDVMLERDGSVRVTDGAATVWFSGAPQNRQHAKRQARLARRARRRSWRCGECGALMRSDVRSGLLARDKRQAPCGHWIVDYVKTERLKHAEAALWRLRRRDWNRAKDAAHNATAALVRTYGGINVVGRPADSVVATELERQLDYKSAWRGRTITRNGTAA